MNKLLSTHPNQVIEPPLIYLEGWSISLVRSKLQQQRQVWEDYRSFYAHKLTPDQIFRAEKQIQIADYLLLAFRLGDYFGNKELFELTLAKLQTQTLLLRKQEKATLERIWK